MNILQKISLYYYIKIRASLGSVYSNKVQNGILKSILNADEVEGRGDINLQRALQKKIFSLIL